MGENTVYICDGFDPNFEPHFFSGRCSRVSIEISSNDYETGAWFIDLNLCDSCMNRFSSSISKAGRYSKDKEIENNKRVKIDQSVKESRWIRFYSPPEIVRYFYPLGAVYDESKWHPNYYLLVVDSNIDFDHAVKYLKEY